MSRSVHDLIDWGEKGGREHARRRNDRRQKGTTGWRWDRCSSGTSGGENLREAGAGASRRDEGKSARGGK